MGAVDQSLVRQGREALQAGPHLLRRSLEHPPAAEREEGVPDEDDGVRRIVIGDVTQRMPPGLHHPEQRLPEPDLVALVQSPVQGRDAGDLLRADDLASGRRLDRLVAAGVVGVPMGVEDQVEPPSQPLQLGQDGLGVGRVDTAGPAGGPVADQEGVVVLQAGELVDLERHRRHL